MMQSYRLLLMLTLLLPFSILAVTPEEVAEITDQPPVRPHKGMPAAEDAPIESTPAAVQAAAEKLMTDLMTKVEREEIWRMVVNLDDVDRDSVIIGVQTSIVRSPHISGKTVCEIISCVDFQVALARIQRLMAPRQRQFFKERMSVEAPVNEQRDILSHVGTLLAAAGPDESEFSAIGPGILAEGLLEVEASMRAGLVADACLLVNRTFTHCDIASLVGSLREYESGERSSLAQCTSRMTHAGTDLEGMRMTLSHLTIYSPLKREALTQAAAPLVKPDMDRWATGEILNQLAPVSPDVRAAVVALAQGRFRAGMQYFDVRKILEEVRETVHAQREAQAHVPTGAPSGRDAEIIQAVEPIGR